MSVYDGSTVVLGGLIREDVQKVEDKTPILGDIPIIGRLFRSSVDQHIKRNLVIFVSARLINAAGEPVRSEDEKEEVIETIAPPEIAPTSCRSCRNKRGRCQRWALLEASRRENPHSPPRCADIAGRVL